MEDLEAVPELPHGPRSSHFFDVYKALQPDKHSSIRGREGADVAWQEIEDCRQRYAESHRT